MAKYATASILHSYCTYRTYSLNTADLTVQKTAPAFPQCFHTERERASESGSCFQMTCLIRLGITGSCLNVLLHEEAFGSFFRSDKTRWVNI